MASGFRALLCLALLLAPAAGLAQASEPSAEEIVQRSLANTRADWEAQPRYSHMERDEDIKGSTHTVYTYRISMIDDSPYQRLTAVNDEPLSAQQAAKEESKLRQETARRAKESAPERARRRAQYHKSRQRLFNLMNEMVNAFDFKLQGQELVDGREAWILNATPRPGYQPTSRETKILTGMKGRLWIDCQDFQWVKAEADVIKPVWFGWFIAKVVPGTHFLLEQAPVTEDLWLPERFHVDVHASLLWMERNFIHDETFRDYRLDSSSAAASE